jgi:hypothetical protein
MGAKNLGGKIREKRPGGPILIASGGNISI